VVCIELNKQASEGLAQHANIEFFGCVLQVNKGNINELHRFNTSEFIW